MDIIAQIAEEKIREAIKKGELDGLSYEGKRLDIEDLSRVPPHLRAGYIILKNAGVLPEELQLKKEIVNLQNLLKSCYAQDEDEKARLQSKLNEKQLKFNLLMEKRQTNPNVVRRYKEKIYNRFSRL